MDPPLTHCWMEPTPPTLCPPRPPSKYPRLIFVLRCDPSAIKISVEDPKKFYRILILHSEKSIFGSGPDLKLSSENAIKSGGKVPNLAGLIHIPATDKKTQATNVDKQRKFYNHK